jgi:hypothetical protein
MPIQSNDLYVRTCQECGKRQESKPVVEYKSDAWRNKPCKFCTSEALDYGSFGWSRNSDGGFYQEPASDDGSEEMEG